MMVMKIILQMLFPFTKYSFKATIYIVLNRFENNWATDKDLDKTSSELNNEKMLSNEQIKTMIKWFN